MITMMIMKTKKSLIPLLAFAACVSTAHAAWKVVAPLEANNGKWALYVDDEGVQKEGQRVRLWTLYDLPTSLRQSLAYRRFITGLLGAFALPAVLLAALGIFGVVAYLVTQRGREIGIRMALGAQRRNVLTLVLAEGMRLAGIGILLGALGAIATTRWLDSELYETSATDPLTFAMAALTLTGISLCAAAIPAQRATAIDPARTLQSE